VAQDFMSITYKGVGSGLRLPFRHNGTSCCAKGAVNDLQTTLQGKAGHPITVMDDWEQSHTKATLSKPAKHCFQSSTRPSKSHLEKQARLSIAILLWYLDSA